MNIIGENVMLRALSTEDTGWLLELINDPETEKMLGGKANPISYDNQKKWIENQDENSNTLRYVIADRNNSERGLGTVILSDVDYINGCAQIHIKMSCRNSRNKGYGSDAVNTIVKYAFNELRLNCIYSEILEYNIPSINLFTRCNFQREGVLRSRVFKEGKYVDVISFSIVRK